MAAHSNLSPSAAKRWIACPGSVALCDQLPKSPTSQNAAEGTCAHELAEKLLKKKLTKAQLVAMIGTKITVEGFDIEVTEEMVDGVTLYYDTVQEHINSLKGNGRNATVVVEYEVKAVASSVDENVYGTCDTRMYQKGNVLRVVDFKYGFSVVEVEHNEQLMIYALAGIDAIKCGAFDSVELEIVQPRARHIDGPVRTWKTTVKELRDFGEKLKAAVAETRNPNAKFDAGPWCRWCDGKAHCPVNFQAVQVVTGADFTGISSPTTLKSLPPVDLLSFDKMTMALDWEEAITAAFSAMRTKIKTELEAGREVLGWKLVDGKKGNRRWIKEDKVIEEFGSLLGDKIYSPRKILSPAQLEEIVGKGKLDSLTERPPGVKKLSRDFDPRPIAITSAQSDFTDATELKQLESKSNDNTLDTLNGLM